MKPRAQVINEIVAKHRTQNSTQQAQTLEAALMNMQDAMLYFLAQDLDIDLEIKTAVRS